MYPVLGDFITRSMPILENYHYRAHTGELFNANYAFDSGAGTSTRYFMIITPNNNNNTHICINTTEYDESIMYLYEDGVVSANGTAIDINNKKRDNTNVPLTGIFYEPTVLSDGNLLETVGNPFGFASISLGGLPNPEWILKPNTIYLIKWVPTAANQDSVVTFQFHESINN